MDKFPARQQLCQSQRDGNCLKSSNILLKTNLFFLQCLDHSWYLAIDFQLFVASLPIILLLHKFKWKFFWLLPLTAVGSAVYVFVTAFQKKLYVTARTREGFNLYNKLLYMPAHSRLSTWLIGMALGFVMHESKTKKILLRKTIDFTMWTASISILFAIIFCAHPFYVQGDSNTTSLLANSSFIALHRIFWTIALSWIVFACQSGSGGVVRTFLSLPHLQPVSKLGLSMYLVHLIYQHLLIMNVQQPIYFDEWQWTHSFFGDLFATSFLAVCLHLVVEQPFCLLEGELSKFIKSKYKT